MRHEAKGVKRVGLFRLPWCHLLSFAVAAISAGIWTVSSWVASTSTQTVEDQIALKIGLKVEKGTVKWMTEPASYGLKDALSWYEVVFLAKERADGEGMGAPRDLFRLEVRSIDGERIFAARNLRNLSRSPSGDESELYAKPPFAAAATRAFGQVRSLTLYDFRGAPRSEADETLGGRIMTGITDFLETGDSRGLGKTTVRFTGAPTSVRFEMRDQTFHAAWKDDRGEAGEAGEVSILPNRDLTDNRDVVVTASVRPAKRPVLWAVDTIRSLSFVGPGPIEWMEGRVFALQDTARQLRYRVLGASVDAISAGLPDEVPPAVLDLPPGLEVGDLSALETWPPTPFEAPVFARKLEGEGEWRPTGPAFLRRIKNAPPAFYRSFVRPDKERPYVTVQLFAMDMRQLELHMQGGYEDPKSTTGSAGDGRIPRRKDLTERIVVAFNGAFKTEHGSYGMMAERNVLLPPQSGAATVAVGPDGSASMGTWPGNPPPSKAGPLGGGPPSEFPIPPEMDSFRQNMDPLVENGVVNPKKRRLWGYTLGNDLSKMQTVRSGLCMSDKGYMIYAWGEEVSALTLGIAMNAAGCSYGMHLDMNPYHTTFMYYSFSLPDESKRPEYKFEPALPQTMYSPHRYLNGSAKDFFFASLREASPGDGFSAEGLAQTAPAFLPSVFRKSENGCDLIAVDLSRVTTHLTPGEIPEHLRPAGHSPDNPAGKERLLVDIDLGPWSADRGQMVNGATCGTLSDEKTVLATDDSGKPEVASWTPSIAAHVQDAVESAAPSDLDPKAASVVGIAVRERWLFIAVGKKEAVTLALKNGGAAEPFALFAAVSDKDGSPRVFVRREKGMANLEGDPILETDMSTTHFQISAAPRPLGAKRLETAFRFTKTEETDKTDLEDVSSRNRRTATSDAKENHGSH